LKQKSGVGRLSFLKKDVFVFAQSSDAPGCGRCEDCFGNAVEERSVDDHAAILVFSGLLFI
jgi:predicted PP-loop superfamily ATPase